MPGVPMEMPSDTVMVLKSTLLPPAASMPLQASRANSPMWALHGVRLPQVEATPICGLPKSASWKPTARNMARAGACLSPSTTTREKCRGSMLRLTNTPSLRNTARGRGDRLLRIGLPPHAVEAECAGERHGKRQQQRKFSGARMTRFEAHVEEHPERRSHSAPHPGQSHVHSHVMLRTADRGEVVVAEIPAEISTGLGRAEQHRANPQQRLPRTEHPGAHRRTREHDRPPLA